MTEEEPWVRPLPSSTAEDSSEQGEEASQRLVEPLPLQPYRQCTHIAVGDAGSEYLQNWRAQRWKERQNFDYTLCSHSARVLLNGQPLCRRHAGMMLLAKCEEMGL